VRVGGDRLDRCGQPAGQLAGGVLGVSVAVVIQEAPVAALPGRQREQQVVLGRAGRAAATSTR